MFGLLTKARRNAGFWLSAQLLFVLPNGVLSLCDAMVEGPLLAESCHSQALEYLIQFPSAVCPDGVHAAELQSLFGEAATDSVWPKLSTLRDR